MSTPPDRRFSVAIRINGAESEDFHGCVEQVTVDENLDRGASFNVRVSLVRNEEGGWPHLEDEDLRPWNRVTIIAAFPERADVVMDGYISHVRPSGAQGRQRVNVEIAGVDASYAMNLDEQRVVWTAEELGGEEPTYEAIARRIIESYGLEAVLPEEGEADDGDSAPSVTQRSTDHRFLRELARRNGYEFYVRGGRAHFHPADLSGRPQKLIAYDFGEETNCDDLVIAVDGTRPTEAAVTRVDPLTGEEHTVTASESGLPALGTTLLSALRGYGVAQRRVVARRPAAMTRSQVERYAAGLLRREGWWLKATGTLDGLCYGRALRAHRLVTIKGFGREFNGNYYVRRVRHELGPRSYKMKFEAYRNGMGQLGTEDFSGERPGAVPLAASAAPGAEEVVRVRETGARVAPE